MEQTTFADWMKQQAEADLKSTVDALWEEANERGGGFDYEEEERAAEQYELTVESLDGAW